ncbi:response regulator transcription factor [Sphingomonas rubra]|uniref:Two component transcriptional regulator, LuxR family n=1 Tax=Sphingomonas rubra TaxID=634430 RepID=A0A1I5TBJ6_9SPHN|nr:response regulator transcription factor [Sphingomonas rubra]SFP80424.1 two component transcriptional regulator, LuxR family [Sphingomonas rubra]
MIRIVVAEDQAMVLGALASLLALEPDITIVGQAHDGEAAISLVRDLLPDVLLTDIEMPGLSGIDVAAAIGAAKLATRVIIVTTFARPGYLSRARDAGVHGYLLKDAPVETLAEAIRTVAVGSRVIPPALAAAAWEAGADPLSGRERAVLRLAEEGLPNKEIARRLSLAPGTIRNYLADAAAKLGAGNRIEAGRLARSRGWL